MAHSTLAAVRNLTPLIAQHADEAERERRLARPVVDALVNAGVFRLLLPPALGGAGASPLEFCEVVETVATVDGSCSGAAEQLIERQIRRNIPYRWICRLILRQNTGRLCTSRQPADDHREDAARPWSTSMQPEKVHVTCAHGPLLERQRRRNIPYRWICRHMFTPGHPAF